MDRSNKNKEKIITVAKIGVSILVLTSCASLYKFTNTEIVFKPRSVFEEDFSNGIYNPEQNIIDYIYNEEGTVETITNTLTAGALDYNNLKDDVKLIDCDNNCYKILRNFSDEVVEINPEKIFCAYDGNVLEEILEFEICNAIKIGDKYFTKDGQDICLNNNIIETYKISDLSDFIITETYIKAIPGDSKKIIGESEYSSRTYEIDNYILTLKK